MSEATRRFRISQPAALAALLAAAVLALAAHRLAGVPLITTREVPVTATAYNSVPEQTHGVPYVAASGERLIPGMRAIAVSRDLLDLGLSYGQTVRIEGLDGDYVVLDTMAPRWTRRIDIYMGDDESAARRWGRREIVLYWPDRAG